MTDLQDLTADIIAFECGELDAEGQTSLFQKLIDTGLAWQLQGAYGRAAEHLIQAGVCTPRPTPDGEPWFSGFEGYFDMLSEFEIDEENIPEYVPTSGAILFAVYSQESYEGSAVVVWLNSDGTYSAVFGAHCSCYGLENQWDTKPDKLTLAELRKQLTDEGWIGERAYSMHESYKTKIEAILAAELNRAKTA